MDVSKIESDWKAKKIAASHEYHFFKIRNKKISNLILTLEISKILKYFKKFPRQSYANLFFSFTNIQVHLTDL